MLNYIRPLLSNSILVGTLNSTNIILVSAVIIALGVIWRLLRFVFKIDRAVPTLLLIAQQFENNGGSTIKDKIDSLYETQQDLITRLEARRMALEQADRVILRIAEDSRLIADTNASIVREMSETSVKDILELEKYMHENMHVLRNQMQSDTYFKDTTNKSLARLEARLDGIMPFINRRRESDIHDSGKIDE
jgi:hypothetical protein